MKCQIMISGKNKKSSLLNKQRVIKVKPSRGASNDYLTTYVFVEKQEKLFIWMVL